MYQPRHPYTYPEHRHRWYVRYTYWLLKFILKPYFRPLIKEVTGLENIPKEGPVIVAFNHQSYLDFFCFIAVCPRPIHYLSAEKFFTHYIWKHLMRFTGQVRVYRKEHDKHILHATIHDHLKNGKVIGIFPEGTRAPDPVEMLHAFTGVAKYAVVGRVPVIPVGIKGTFEVLSRHDRKPKYKKKTVSIHIGEPIHFTEHHGKNLTEAEYRRLTDQVMLEIARLAGKRYSYVGKEKNE